MRQVLEAIGGPAAVLALCVWAILHGCASDTAQAPLQDSFFVRKSPNADGVIVFIHGVTGDAKATWQNAASSAYWPELIRDDPEFSNFDIYVYEYPSPLFRQSYNIDEVAENVRLQLESDQVVEYSELIFIAHSMGGLVTRAYLQKYQDVATRVRFIALYSTPTSGADLGRLASFLSNNPQFGEMAPIQSGGEFLAQQMRAWQAGRFGIRTYCAYETRDTLDVRIVEMASASLLCTEPLNPLDENHLSIVKPFGDKAPAYLAFKNAYRETRAVVTFSVPSQTKFEAAIRSLVALESNAGVRFEDCEPGILSTPLPELGDRYSNTQTAMQRIAVRAGLQATIDVNQLDGGKIYVIRCDSPGARIP